MSGLPAKGAAQTDPPIWVGASQASGRQEPQVRLAARESVARRAAGWGLGQRVRVLVFALDADAAGQQP